MANDDSAEKARRTDRPDGRRQMLLYLRPDLIHELKVLSAVQQLHAYEVVEAILDEHLKGHPELKRMKP